MKNRTWVTAACAAVSLLSCIIIPVLASPGTLPRDHDTEFQSGTGIRIDSLSDIQTDSLCRLCKVWGYVKYRHPSVLDGSYNWDAELFRVMPDILKAGSEDETNTILFDWLSHFPFDRTTLSMLPADDLRSEQMWINMQNQEGVLESDTDWIYQSDELGTELSGYLRDLNEVYVSDRSDSYAVLDITGHVRFENESPILSFTPEDDGAKLLALFRFWNIYEYFSPYRDLTKADWDQVLADAIPRFVSAVTYRDYVLAVAETAAFTGDAHIQIQNEENTISSFYGNYFLPCSFLDIDGMPVICDVDDSLAHNPLQTGDIITSVDGISIPERIHTLSRYVPLPEEEKYAYCLSNNLLNTKAEQAEVTVIRDGKPLSFTVSTLQSSPRIPAHPESRLSVDGQIGYLNLSMITDEQTLAAQMKEFEQTKGLIIDLRDYPARQMISSLGTFFLSEPAVFARVSIPNRVLPGSFVAADVIIEKTDPKTEHDTSPYAGKVVILMNEETMSRGEYTVMALRQIPGAVIVGSPSLGADGDITDVSLPGGITFSMSGFGIYTPDGGQTQRTGLVPDVECRPTIEGLKSDRDELMEKAEEIIRNETASLVQP